MSKFFNPALAASKKNAVTDSLSLPGNTTVGIPYGWYNKQSLSVSLEASFAMMEDGLLTCVHNWTDLRVIQTVAYLSATSWQTTKEFTHPELDKSKLIALKFSSLLFPRWTQQTELSLVGYMAMLANINSKLEPDQRTEMEDVWREAINGAVSPAGVLDITLVNRLKDLGLTAVSFKAGPWRLFQEKINQPDAIAIPNWHVVADASFLAVGPNCPIEVQHQWTVEAQLGGLYTWLYARKNSLKLKTAYGTALMVFITSFVRTTSPTDAWIRNRATQLEQGLGIATGSIEMNSSMLDVYRDLLRFAGLTTAQIYNALSHLGKNAAAMDVDRIHWMVQQAAYTNLTVPVTMYQILADFSFIPLGILFDELENEVGFLNRAAVWSYLHPYGGLKSIKYTTTQFPTIASALKDLCVSLGMTTFTKFNGNYTGTSLEKKDRMVMMFNQMKTDAGSEDAIRSTIENIINGRVITRMAHSRGITSVDMAPANAVGLMPPNLPADFAGLVRNPTQDSFDIGTKKLYEYIRSREIANANLNPNIKDLYTLLTAIGADLKTSPVDANHTIGSFTRPVPAQGPIYDYIIAHGGEVIFNA